MWLIKALPEKERNCWIHYSALGLSGGQEWVFLFRNTIASAMGSVDKEVETIQRLRGREPRDRPSQVSSRIGTVLMRRGQIWLNWILSWSCWSGGRIIKQNQTISSGGKGGAPWEVLDFRLSKERMIGLKFIIGRRSIGSFLGTFMKNSVSTNTSTGGAGFWSINLMVIENWYNSKLLP